MNHRWTNNKCTKCGIERDMRPYKQRMAITLDGKDHYIYGRSYVYTGEGIKETTVRPECPPKKYFPAILQQINF